jgi:hypothetical protein
MSVKKVARNPNGFPTRLALPAEAGASRRIFGSLRKSFAKLLLRELIKKEKKMSRAWDKFVEAQSTHKKLAEAKKKIAKKGGGGKK